MNLNHKIFGDGPPLIILHGLFGMLDNWQTLARRWAEQYTVILVDQRNHGRSPHTEEHTYPLMANDLMEFMGFKGIYEANIMGHSMGGKTAMQFAQYHPEMVNKLIVVDIAPKIYQAGHNVIFEALTRFPLQEINDRKAADAWLAKRIPEASVRQFLLKNLTRDKTTGGYRWKMNLPVLQDHYQDVLLNIEEGDVFEEPALFIRGDRSHYVQDEDILTILDLFLNARVETIADAGHWVHAEQPEILFQLVSDFLAE